MKHSLRTGVLGALLGSAMAISAVGGAQAATVANFTLDVFDPATGFTVTPVGTITVTDTGTGLSVSGILNAAYEFRHNPSKKSGVPDFMFNTPSADAAETSLSTPFVQRTGGSPYGSTPGESTLGQWDNGIDCPAGAKGTACQVGWTPGVNPTSISFNLPGLTLADLEANPNSAFGKQIYFATDVVNAAGNTGFVGAELAVPEPATWAMMMVGCGLMGAALRRRRTALNLAA